MSQPVYLPAPPSYPMAYPTPALASPGAWTARPAQMVAAPASFNVQAQQQSAPRPIIRAKGPDEPTSSPSFAPVAYASGPGHRSSSAIPLSIPTPEQLGIAPAVGANDADLDWTDTHRRLERLGAVSFRLDKVQAGGCHFACLLSTRQPGLTHRVEADAPTSAEAIHLVLDQAEQWVRTGNGSSK